MAPVPLIPNGIYQIQNDQYSGNLVTYLAPQPGGPILGYTQISPPDVKQEVRAVICRGLYSPVQQWLITNEGDGGNQVTIESVSTPGSFATAAGFFQVRALDVNGMEYANVQCDFSMDEPDDHS